MVKKIMIFTKGKGKLNKATVDWEEKEELIDYTTKDTILKALSEIKKLLKESDNIEELRVVANGTSYQVKKDKSKVNDDIYKIPKYCIQDTHIYLIKKQHCGVADRIIIKAIIKKSLILNNSQTN